MSIVVFTGPTISAEDALQELDATYLPPVSQGDVYRAVARKPLAIGIIDGYFDRVPAVWHKEILWALSEGIHVFGAASMGALRAAELAAFGMVGIGSIFENFRDGFLEDDDEVAVVHAPQELGFQVCSDAMVNIRQTLQRACAESVISDATRKALVEIAKGLFYQKRLFQVILGIARERRLGLSELSALESWLPANRVDQKRNDALAMLRHIRTFVEEPQTRHEPTFSFEHTQLWERLCQSAGFQGIDAEPVLCETLVEELRVRGHPYFESLQASLQRRLSIAYARRTGIVLSDEDVSEAMESIRKSNRLLEPDDVHAWMKTNELNVEGFYHLVEDQAFLRRATSLICHDSDQYMIDHLRVTGEYLPLLNRAKEKQKKLLDMGLEEPDLSYAGLDRERLFAWYFQEVLSADNPEDIRGYAAKLGCSEDDFLRMVLREYLFLTVRTH
jgi:hypothetical protein